MTPVLESWTSWTCKSHEGALQIPPNSLKSQVYYFNCYFQAEIQQQQQQQPTTRTFIAEKTKVSALGVYLLHAPDPRARDVQGGRARSKTLGQLKAIVDKEAVDESVRIKAFDDKGRSLGMKKLSEFGSLDTWADIFARLGLKNHPGSLLSVVDEHMDKLNIEKSIANFRQQKAAIVQTALNIVTGYVPGKEMLLIAIAQLLTCYHYTGAYHSTWTRGRNPNHPSSHN